MKTVSLRLKDAEVAAIEAVMQRTRNKTQTAVIRQALKALFASEGVIPSEALRVKQAQEWKTKYGKRRGPV